jgi:hypothetical protein
MSRFRGFVPTRRGIRVLALMGLLGLVAEPVGVLSAQDLSYTTVTSVEFGGAMGMMMQMMPQAGMETREAVYIKGSLMRTDDDDTSTIMDMSNGRYTMLDHESRTYYTITLADMQQQMEMAQERMAQAMGNPEGGMGPGMGPGPEGSFDVHVSTDRTGRTRDFGGYSAEQVLITMEMVPTSPESQQSVAETGTTVLFTELWLSEDFPGAAEYREAQERAGQAFLEGGGGAMASGMMGPAMMGNPDMKEAFEKNWEEMKNMEGVPVRTTTHMVTVPAGMEFDPDAVLAAEDQPLEAGDMPSGMDAAMGALGRRMGGMLGRGNREEADPEAPAGPTTQTITMRSVSTIEEIDTGALSDDLFQPPPDYTERQPEWMRGG